MDILLPNQEAARVSGYFEHQEGSYISMPATNSACKVMIFFATLCPSFKSPINHMSCFAFYCCNGSHKQKQLRDEKKSLFQFTCPSLSSLWRELKARTETGSMGKDCLLACFSLIPPIIPVQGWVALSTVDWAFVKKMPRKLAHWPS